MYLSCLECEKLILATNKRIKNFYKFHERIVEQLDVDYENNCDDIFEQIVADYLEVGINGK